MFEKFRNSKKRGDAGLGMAIAWFTGEGYTVSLPLTDSQDYDLVVEFDHRLYKVQVTTCSHKEESGNYRVELRTVSYGGKDYNIKHFDNKSIDYLFVITDDGTKYLIPSSIVQNINNLTLNDAYVQFKVD